MKVSLPDSDRLNAMSVIAWLDPKLGRGNLPNVKRGAAAASLETLLGAVAAASDAAEKIARLQAQVAELQRRLDVSEKQADGLFDTGLAHCDKIDTLRAQVDALSGALHDLLDAHARNTLFSGAGHWDVARAALAAAGR